jgi:hypothetical protein
MPDRDNERDRFPITLHPYALLQEAANRALCSLSKASPETASIVLNAGLVQNIKQQLDGTDDNVKEAGLNAIATISTTSADMATAVLDDELLDKIITITRSPAAPLFLLESACTALASFAAHTGALAQRILAAGAAPALLAVLGNKRAGEPRLLAAALRCLCHLAHHEASAATAVADAGAVAVAMRFVVDDLNPTVRHAAAALLQQIAVRTPSLSAAVASDGCVAALLESLKLEEGSSFALAPVTALAHIGAFGATFAQAVRFHVKLTCTFITGMLSIVHSRNARCHPQSYVSGLVTNNARVFSSVAMFAFIHCASWRCCPRCSLL